MGPRAGVRALEHESAGWGRPVPTVGRSWPVDTHQFNRMSRSQFRGVAESGERTRFCISQPLWDSVAYVLPPVRAASLA